MDLIHIIRDSRYFATISCLTNDTIISSLYVITDVLISVSMLAMGLRLWTKRKQGYYLLPYQCTMVGMIAFLLALAFIMDLVTLLEGFYRIEIMVRGTIAGISVVLAFTCFLRRDA